MRKRTWKSWISDILALLALVLLLAAMFAVSGYLPLIWPALER